MRTYKLRLDKGAIATIDIERDNIGVRGETLDGKFKVLNDKEYIVAINAGSEFSTRGIPSESVYSLNLSVEEAYKRIQRFNPEIIKMVQSALMILPQGWGHMHHSEFSHSLNELLDREYGKVERK